MPGFQAAGQPWRALLARMPVPLGAAGEMRNDKALGEPKDVMQNSN